MFTNCTILIIKLLFYLAKQTSVFSSNFFQVIHSRLFKTYFKNMKYNSHDELQS